MSLTVKTLVDGSTPYRNINVGTTGAIVKANGGQIFLGIVSNTNAAVRYLKIYNKATAPTQADTPALTILLPATSTLVIDASSGIPFSTGISLRATTGVADNDTGAPSANDVLVNIDYL